MRRFLLALLALAMVTQYLLAQQHKPGEEIEVEIVKDVKMKFCWVPAGEAQLGSPAAERLEVLRNTNRREEPEWLAAEAEEKRGKFRTKGFWLGKYLVTQKQWEGLMGKNPSHFVPTLDIIKKAGIRDTSRFPVEQVSWNDCQNFLKKLNDSVTVPATMGKGKFMLPHENQWEYAARGGKGNRQAFYFGNELNGTQANCDGNGPFGTTTKGPSLDRTSEVGSYEKKVPHPWGPSDMSGNLYQWCENLYRSGETGRALRGGSWNIPAWTCRSASRNGFAPDYWDAGYGFRVCFPLD